jgi:excisionase family DNA binding protein
MEKLLSPTELADYFGIPIATIYQWRHRGVGPRGMRVGKHLRYRRSDVEQWLESQADAPGSAA